MKVSTENEAETCQHCGKDVKVMAFRGTGVCSDKCKKTLGRDITSVGTYMFVTAGEKAAIDEARAHDNSR